MMETLKILSVQTIPCVRNHKTSYVLKQLGHKIHLAYNCLMNEPLRKVYETAFNELFYYKTEEELISYLLHEKFDLVVTHNNTPILPDTLPIIIKKRLPHIKLIHYVHDLDSAYSSTNKKDISIIEKIAFNYADALIVVSKEMKALILIKYPELSNKQFLILPNYILKENVPKIDKPRLSERYGKIHIGYAGGFSLNSEHRNYLNFFKELEKEGFVLHIHLANQITESEIKEIKKINNAYFYSPIVQDVLFKRLTEYDFGYVGYSCDNLITQIALPNKLFEYASAGLPIIAQPFIAIKKFIEKNKLGFVFNTIREIKDNIPKWKNYRKQKLFLMDDHTTELTEFYKSI